MGSDPEMKAEVSNDEDVQVRRASVIMEEIEHGGDAALQALKNQDLSFTVEEDRRVQRKIDWHLMPLMAWACGLQLVDKV